MASFIKKLFKGSKFDAAPEEAARTTANPNDGALVQASNLPVPTPESADENALAGGARLGSTAIGASARIVNVHDALVVGEAGINNLLRAVTAREAQSAVNHGSGIGYDDLEYLLTEVGSYKSQIVMEYMDDEPDERDDHVKQNIKDKWALVQDELERFDEHMNELNSRFAYPDNPEKAVPLKEAHVFCVTARKVLQSARHAETLFAAFREAKKRMQKEKEKVKAARLQRETVRVQNAATIMGSLADSANRIASMIVPANPAAAAAAATA